MKQGTYVNMGDEVIEQLKENTKIGWVFTDTSEEAIEGVNSGEYYAAVVISEDFTDRMYEAFSRDFENPVITYYENEKKNAVATKITDTAVSTLQESINEKFVEVAVSSIFEKTNSLSDDIESGDKIDQFVQKLNALNENLISYNQMIDSFLDGNESLKDAISAANGQIPGLTSKVGNAITSLGDTRSDFGQTQTTVSAFSQNVKDSLGEIETSIDQVASDIKNAGLADKAENSAENIGKTVEDTNQLLQQLNTLQKALVDMKSEDLSDNEAAAIKKALETIADIRSGATDVHSAMSQLQNTTAGLDENTIKDQLRDGVEGVTGGMAATIESASTQIDNIRNIYSATLVPQMDSILDGVGQILNNVTNMLGDLNNTLTNMGNVFNGVNTTVSGTSDSLESIQKVLQSVSDRISAMTEKVNAAGDDEKVQALLDLMGGDPQAYGAYFAEPVEVKSQEIYPIENYGSAVTPFYTVLALWVGGLILVSVLKVKAKADELIAPKSYQLFFGRYLIFFLLGQIQALIIVLGNVFLLHCQILYPGLFWLTASLTSFTFTLLIYSLTLSFGDIGKALLVVIMVIQIAGSGGTYPIEILPDFYRNVYTFFPFPYAINALRETIGGMYGSTYMKSLAEVLIFAVVALLTGLVIRIPFVGINHFVEKRMEDTKMM